IEKLSAPRQAATASFVHARPRLAATSGFHTQPSSLPVAARIDAPCRPSVLSEETDTTRAKSLAVELAGDHLPVRRTHRLTTVAPTGECEQEFCVQPGGRDDVPFPPALSGKVHLRAEAHLGG